MGQDAAVGPAPEPISLATDQCRAESDGAKAKVKELFLFG